MSLSTLESLCILGGLLVFHGAVRWLGVGGPRPWGHQVIWVGLTAGSCMGWGLLFRQPMPWGHRDVLVIARGYDVYDEYYSMYVTSMVLLYLYYALSSIVVDWFPSDDGGKTRWPGVWWTLTHLVFLPVVTCLVVLDSLQHLRPPVLNVMVSLWLRYHIWLVGDSSLSLWFATSADDVDYDGPEDERKRWTYLRLILWLARLYSLLRLGQWLHVCLPSAFLPADGNWSLMWSGVWPWVLDFTWRIRNAWETFEIAFW